jgi:serine/threonine-protein kinase
MLVGQQLGPFSIEKELGSGAMGSVFRARYTKTGQRVAIKIVAANLTGSDKAMSRFEREADILKQLRHPNIVRLYATGRYHRTPFYAMEYIEGESLDHVMARRGRMSWEEVATLGKQLCSALQHAHEKGIIHRDLKPSNLMMLPNGTVKLTDFGIAKDLDVTQLTSANCTVGTAAYMAPEQCRGERDLTHKCDLYSMGVLFYELVTGRKPFLAETPMDMFLLHVQGIPERPSRLVLDLPVWFDTLIFQLLEKKPEQRPLNAAAVEQALNQIEEKVEAQQSAGEDVVRTKVVNRPKAREELDDEDREAARSLLGKRRKRRRKRDSGGVRFYHQVWFKAALFSLLLVGVAYAIYQVFLKRPSPEALHQKAWDLMAGATEAADWDEARKGPVADFLKYYRKRDDEQAREMQVFADWVDLFNRERLVGFWRRQGIEISNETEATARTALGQEEGGNLTEAWNSWESLLEKKEASDAELRSYGLLAEKRLGDLQQVFHFAKDLQAKMDRRPAGDQTLPYEKDKGNGPELRAFHYAQFQDYWKARDLWQQRQHDLKTRYDPRTGGLFDQYAKALKDWLALPDETRAKTDPKVFLWETTGPGLRTRYLLATWQWQVMKTKAGSGKDETRARLKLIRKKLKEAEDLVDKRKSRKARVIYQDIVALYGKDSDDDVRKEADKARKELKALSNR